METIRNLVNELVFLGFLNGIDMTVVVKSSTINILMS